jgi:hypothetical protein
MLEQLEDAHTSATTAAAATKSDPLALALLSLVSLLLVCSGHRLIPVVRTHWRQRRFVFLLLRIQVRRKGKSTECELDKGYSEGPDVRLDSVLCSLDALRLDNVIETIP